jgi:2-dehydropantoate 2-reductase
VRYIIIGAGAIGGVLGARLFQHRPERAPVLVARGEHGAALLRDGLRLRTFDEDSRLRVEVVLDPADVRLRPDDVLVLTTKTHQAGAALDQWVGREVYGDDGSVLGIAGDVLPVLTATNGIESERIALRLFQRVFGVCVWLPAVQLTPGEVILRIGPSSGTFIVGRFGGAADERDTALLASIAADWAASTFSVRIVEDIMYWKRQKLLSNLANGLQALAGADADIRPLADRLTAEAEAVYRMAGLEWASDAEEAEWRGEDFRIRVVPGQPDELGGSSWQSIARGSGSIESDYLNGEIVLMARSMGSTAPLNQLVQGLARSAAGSRAGVGSVSLVELEREFARVVDDRSR